MYHPFIPQTKEAGVPQLLLDGVSRLKGLASPFAKAWGAMSKAKPPPLPKVPVPSMPGLRPSAAGGVGVPPVSAASAGGVATSLPTPAPRGNLLSRFAGGLENNMNKLMAGSLLAGGASYGAQAIDNTISAKRNWHGLNDALQSKLDGVSEGLAMGAHHLSQLPAWQRGAFAMMPDSVINSEGVRSKILQAIQSNPNKDVQNYGPGVLGRALDAYGRLRKGETLQGMPQAPDYMKAWAQQTAEQEAKMREYLKRLEELGRTGVNAGGAPPPIT